MGHKLAIATDWLELRFEFYDLSFKSTLVLTRGTDLGVNCVASYICGSVMPPGFLWHDYTVYVVSQSNAPLLEKKLLFVPHGQLS